MGKSKKKSVEVILVCSSGVMRLKLQIYSQCVLSASTWQRLMGFTPKDLVILPRACFIGLQVASTMIVRHTSLTHVTASGNIISL